LLEPRLERPVIHAVNQVERALAELDGIVAGSFCRDGN
jgi:hypothetical protein